MTRSDIADWHYSRNCNIPSDRQLPQGINRYAAVVSYDGSAFCGFQKQSHSPSVQAELEKALSFVANEPVHLSCAGRTDTGVHASGQVVHFDTRAVRSGYSWVQGANSKLPDSVSLLWADQVAAQFHARFSATARTYRYVIHSSPARSAVLANGVTWVRHALDLQAMQRAAQYLLGERDFTAFRGAGCQSNSPFRNVMHAFVAQSGSLVVFEIKANAFVLHMVRNIVGSLLEVGLGRQSPAWIGELLESRDRKLSAATAPPQGLYLVDVDYPQRLGVAVPQSGPLFLPARLSPVGKEGQSA